MKNMFRLFKNKNMDYDSWTPCMKKCLGNPNIYQVDFNAKIKKNMDLLEKQYVLSSCHQNPIEIDSCIRNLNTPLSPKRFYYRRLRDSYYTMKTKLEPV